MEGRPLFLLGIGDDCTCPAHHPRRNDLSTSREGRVDPAVIMEFAGGRGACISPCYTLVWWRD